MLLCPLIWVLNYEPIILLGMLQMRTLEVYGTSVDDIRNFEYSCLGEVRILGALQHPCIVEMYGHHISSKWAPPVDGSSGHRMLQSVIFMEYIKGGSLKVNFTVVG